MAFTVPLAAATGDKLRDLELLGRELMQLGDAGVGQPAVEAAATAHAIGCEILDILRGRQRSGQLVLGPAMRPAQEAGRR